MHTYPHISWNGKGHHVRRFQALYSASSGTLLTRVITWVTATVMLWKLQANEISEELPITAVSWFVETGVSRSLVSTRKNGRDGKPSAIFTMGSTERGNGEIETSSKRDLKTTSVKPSFVRQIDGHNLGAKKRVQSSYAYRWATGRNMYATLLSSLPFDQEMLKREAR